MSSESNSEDSSKYCKFCFGTEDDNNLSFIHPCRCKGTIHWVHHQCLAMWFAKANAVQQVMCIQCQTRYQKRLTLKPWRSWSLPRLNMDIWNWMEISIDLWLTWRMVSGLVGMMNGTRGLYRQLILCTMWKWTMASGRRFCYYGNLGLRLASSIFSISIDDFDERREIQNNLPSDMNWEEISRASVAN